MSRCEKSNDGGTVKCPYCGEKTVLRFDVLSRVNRCGNWWCGAIVVSEGRETTERVADKEDI